MMGFVAPVRPTLLERRGLGGKGTSGGRLSSVVGRDVRVVQMISLKCMIPRGIFEYTVV